MYFCVSGMCREREESRSPERYSLAGEVRSRGRDTVRLGPVTRTQSAASVRQAGERLQDRSSSVRPAGERLQDRSSSQQRPSSALGSVVSSSSEGLYRSPSYRLLGGRLMDTLASRDSSWREEASGGQGDQILNITRLDHQSAPHQSYEYSREPYLIKTKDGRKQTLAEYEKSLVEDYKRRSQLNLS